MRNPEPDEGDASCDRFSCCCKRNRCQQQDRPFCQLIHLSLSAQVLNPRRFSRFALYSVKGMRIGAHGSMALMKGQSAPHMFPDSQFAIKSTFWRSVDEIRTIRPEKAIENPAPVNTSLTGCIPTVRLRNCHKRW